MGSRAEREKALKRNPHPDFKVVESSRPQWQKREFKFTKTVDPDWKFGQGGNDNGMSLGKKHVEIDPHEEGRPVAFNYKLIISGMIPRPISFIGTLSEDGKSSNLAPMSATNFLTYDPPVFCVGFDGGLDDAKDTLKNLADTKECVINIISEHFIEAANATAVDAPFGVSEWVLSGLHPAPCSQVKASRVEESIFSIECHLMELKEFNSRAKPGKKSGVLAILEGVRFWVREDALNEDKNLIDPNVLKPMSRLGGISYGRLLDGIEIPRPTWEESSKLPGLEKLIKPKAEGQ